MPGVVGLSEYVLPGPRISGGGLSWVWPRGHRGPGLVGPVARGPLGSWARPRGPGLVGPVARGPVGPWARPRRPGLVGPASWSRPRVPGLVGPASWARPRG